MTNPHHVNSGARRRGRCNLSRGLRAYGMICSSGRSTTSMVMSLRMLDARTRGSQSETGLAPKAKWGLTPVSVQAGCVRPSGLCFLGVRVKAKRNGYFRGRHWETLGPRPPEYGCKQEGPVQFQWVTRCNIVIGDSFLGNPGTICTASNHPNPLRKRGETSLQRTLPIMPFR